MKILGRLGRINRDQCGFTLIELIVALAICGLIIGGISTTIAQALTCPAQSNDHMTAVKQVENAIDCMKRDVVQAQTVEPSGDSGFPLNLTWVDWSNTRHEVTYSLEDGELQRGYVTYDVEGAVASKQTRVVAEYIDSNSEMTNCQMDGKVLTLKITATIEGYKDSSETRQVEILARPAS